MEKFQDAVDLIRLDKDRNMRISLFRRVWALLVKLTYLVWLALLRETAIRFALIQNYEKMPDSLDKKRIGLYIKYPKMKNLLVRLDKRLRRRLY